MCQTKIESLEKSSNCVPILKGDNKRLLDNEKVMQIKIDHLMSIKVNLSFYLILF